MNLDNIKCIQEKVSSLTCMALKLNILLSFNPANTSVTVDFRLKLGLLHEMIVTILTTSWYCVERIK